MTRFLLGLLAAFTLACVPAAAQTTVPFTGSFALPPQPAQVDYGPKLDAILAAIAKLGTGTPTTPPLPGPTPGQPIPPALALQNFSGYQITAGNNGTNPISASTWKNGSARNAFLASNVKVVGPDVVLKADDAGGAEISWNVDVITVGAVTADVEVSQMYGGYVAATIWLYENNGKGELDIELLGTKGAQLNVNNQGIYNLHPVLVPGDFTGRHIWRIEYDRGNYAKFYCDGKLLATITPADMVIPYDWTSPTGVKYKLGQAAPELFPTVGLKPMSSLWTNANTGWTGQFIPGKSVTLTLHGYQRNKVF